ncbi:calmodulin-binding transcription activator 6-like isoform X2 [Salvia hispanica]|uniref:calmodulin-binding transcription activator 6-like isoform X2 n=1 Tax=Salvia hispanica TaxID=49212 RepID=UPI002009ACB0|nr:calmodulin-binding transcription activator 6-like isoform X2 [Salvia hispanica]
MEGNSVPGGLVGSEIHGFRTLEDLDFKNISEEATSRWLRPNEIHAILSNHKYFTVYVKPMNLPTSGTIVLFDRKMLRNFRKDGHNWKKKKDGKTVKEAHEHLKVGNEERIHVYYAHGENNTTFVRRCYWLLDKSLENIVLVHYRETQENSLATPVNSPLTTWTLPEGSEPAIDSMYYDGSMPVLVRNDSVVIKTHEQRLYEINTLDWDELVVPIDPNNHSSPQEAANTAGFELPNQCHMNNYKISTDAQSTNKVSPESSYSSFSGQVACAVNYNIPNNSSYQRVDHDTTFSSDTNISGLVTLDGVGNGMHLVGPDGYQSQDGFGTTHVIAGSPESVDNHSLEPSLLNPHKSYLYNMKDNNRYSPLGQIFTVTDISPSWAISTEETKILVVGFFSDGHQQYEDSKLCLACGDSVVPVEVVQAGVYRCLISSQAPGLVNLFITFDGCKPVSQVLTFEFRAPIQPKGFISAENTDNWEEFQLQLRLSRLLFSSSKDLSIYSSKPSQNALKEAKVFAKKTSAVSQEWGKLCKMIEDAKMSFPQAKERLFELTLENRLHEWLLEKVATGYKITDRDEQGQGVIHLCAVLGYTWAVHLYSKSSLSLDYRDKYGWTALHWAAYYGREKMVAVLLSVGAKPNLVTDPTSQNPGGCTAADLASLSGHEGLAAFLAEKSLVAQFKDMTLAGNVSGSLQMTTNDMVDTGSFTEEEVYLKDALTAYRTAADAAARIQAAFRDHSFKVQTQAVEALSPEIEARNIVAAMRIQHAFRNYETRKKISAAARIQYRFRTWKIRKDFLNMRRQAIRIQANFRGFQVRRQYRKICWSVGVIEKAVLRWRQKRKGFRGLQVQPDETPQDQNEEIGSEEDFFKASRKQAEERVERSVVKVQAMFRSRQAQEEYRRMKLECSRATLDSEELLHPDSEMG